MDESSLVLETLQRLLADWQDGCGHAPTVAQATRFWQGLGETGLLGVFAPESCGGLGAAEGSARTGKLAFDFLCEWGKAAAPGPVIASAVGASVVLPGTAQEGLLAGMADGSVRIAMASALDPSGTTLPDPFGPAAFLRDAGVATHAILPLRRGGEAVLACLAIDRLALSAPFTLVDGATAASLTAQPNDLRDEEVLARGEAAEALWAGASGRMTAAIAAEGVGLAQAMLDQTTAYVRQRVQFGQPIGAFQAIQHRLADMMVDVQQARSLALAANLAPDNAPLVSAAKARVNRSLQYVADQAVQLHGGIGTTQELALNRYFRRAMAIGREFGSSGQHQSRVATALEQRIAGTGNGLHGPSANGSADANETFRAEVRAFLDRALTPELRAEADRQTGTFAEPSLAARWHAILHQQGWIAPGWPVEHGGPGWTARQRLIFERECALANAPVLPAMGINMCGPVLIGHGTPEQKERFLPRILSGEHRWCQGYSEPGAGSDLASLKTRAVRDGDDYVIDGTKIWTTFAHASNWMFLLARTDTECRPQAGISFFLVPMDTPGITVTPILSMSGEHEVNQVFLDGVRVPASLRVGEENAGWTVAKYLLEFERGGVAATARTLRVVGLLDRLARSMGGLPPAIMARYAELAIEILATEETQQQMLAALDAGQSVGNVNASILKLKASELYQQASRLFLDAVGEWGLVDQGDALFRDGRATGPDLAITAAARFMNSRALSIFGGSSEIQKTILAKQALQL